ncbi:MAG TPA: alkaline phosphatase D family protein [Thermoleophilaceae bacterium]|nr:alkaline phosphatase D family protein [Thermoleophilaceae bacterium]
MSRRHFVSMGGVGAAAVAFGGVRSFLPASTDAGRFRSNPFTLGVASGDPEPGGVVLWTRLAPDPLEGGGMRPRPVPVGWEVAEDERWRRVVARGEETARPQEGHSVHAEVTGLRPGREYFYRFMAGGEESPAGRTRTAPAPGSDAAVRFAFASCQHYEHGHYTAYEHMAKEDLDLVLHLGDYIYEFAPEEYKAPSGVARTYAAAEPTTLNGYRDRYAQHKLDPHLQAAHQAFAFAVTWDDHEVKDNYAGLTCGDADPAAFRARRAAAYQAYWEHMPLRRRSRPGRDEMRIYRRLDYGRQVRFNVLDTRQYRADQQPAGTPGWGARARSALGPDQERWLVDGLARSDARWNVVAQQIFFAQRDSLPGIARDVRPDAWDGYPAARARLTRALGRASNPVVLSGDVHSNWANHVMDDYRDPTAKVVATEFVGTSISSGGDGQDVRPDLASLLSENPHVKFTNGQRGYVRCRVDPREWQTDYRVVPYVSRPGAGVSTRASFTVRAGEAGLAGAEALAA